MSPQPVAALTPDSVNRGPCHHQDCASVSLSPANELMNLSLSAYPSAVGETVQLCNPTIQMNDLHTHSHTHTPRDSS